MEIDLKKSFEIFKKVNIQDFIEEIAKELAKMEQELVIDRIENNIAVCEDRNTKKKVEIAIEKLPTNIKEGNVLKYEKGKYQLDPKKQAEIDKTIEEKMNRLWKK